MPNIITYIQLTYNYDHNSLCRVLLPSCVLASLFMKCVAVWLVLCCSTVLKHYGKRPVASFLKEGLFTPSLIFLITLMSIMWNESKSGAVVMLHYVFLWGHLSHIVKVQSRHSSNRKNSWKWYTYMYICTCLYIFIWIRYFSVRSQIIWIYLKMCYFGSDITSSHRMSHN